ncbi:hypothetical protein BGZ73_005662 [Actinomortierella ambigua]|nr:hypothetical protein BGZ73_005662 [Actinomortierella ambigua]
MVRSRLGTGSYGTVYRGRWGTREVAAKVFHVSESEANQLCIQQEIQTLQKLSYRHIIQFYGTAHHNGCLALLMDLADGGCLKAAIDKGTLDWPTRYRLHQEIVRGLAYIHSEKILHRDLKSENVLLSSSMEVKLSDFGCSTIKTTSATRSTDRLSGTVRWMAPELFTRRPVYSTKSDMYSLGVVMWEMAANCTTPFKDVPNSFVVMSLVKEGEREELPEDTPPDYREWVMKCWEGDPKERLDAADMIKVNETPMESETAGVPNATYLSFDFDGMSISSTVSSHLRTVASNSNSGGRSTTGLSTPLGEPSTLGDQQEKNSTLRHTVTRDDADPLVDVVATIRGSGSDIGGDNVEAVAGIIAAANQGHIESQIQLGDMYFHGQGVIQDVGKAIQWYQRAAEQGSMVAQFRLGTLFEEGQAIDRDETLACFWFNKAAHQGLHDAQFRLGCMYETGRGTRQDDAAALTWFHRAAMQNHTIAQRKLGVFYRDGRGGQQNDVEACKWLLRAAEQRDAESEFMLATMITRGRGVERNVDIAFSWMKKAAEHGHSPAQDELGWMYHKGIHVAQDDQAAFQWLQQAAEQDDPSATFRLAYLYGVGKGTKHHPGKAFENYYKAAKLGHLDSMATVGYMFQHGIATEKNYGEAMEWSLKAAERGNRNGMYDVGLMHLEGLGTPKDLAKAMGWFYKAAKAGHDQAKLKVVELEE